MTPERYAAITRVLNHRQPDLTVVADEVHKGRNMAAIMRTCDAVGIGKIYGVQPEAGYKPFRGTALGANKWVEAELWPTLDEPLHALKSQGFQVVATGFGPQACNYRDVDYTLPTAVVMGGEKQGISDTAKAITDHFVTIPMVGMVESLNVSVAAAIILNEAQHQRQRAGLYSSCRLDPEEFKRLFFKWAHPQVAEYCNQNHLYYPSLREDGEIKDPSAWHDSVLKGQAAKLSDSEILKLQRVQRPRVLNHRFA